MIVVSFVDKLFVGKTCTCLGPGTIVAVEIEGGLTDVGIELIDVGVGEDIYRMKNSIVCFVRFERTYIRSRW